MSEYDSPWKEALEHFLRMFMAFFFPDVFRGIDWSRGYEILDKELQQIVRDGELGVRLADKLFKVWRLDGEEAWVFVHIEVQNQRDEEFGERMYIYNYRIFDRFQRPVVSLAVLGDQQRRWRPRQYGYSLWGFSLRVKFPVVKLIDYANREAELEADSNPFAAVVLAHLKAAETARQPELRRDWKLRLVKGLFERGLTAEEIRQLFRLIDWMMELPRELEQTFREEIHRYEEEKKMPYVTSIERLAREEGIALGIEKGIEKGTVEGELRGLQKGLELALRLKFGAAGEELLPTVRSVRKLDVLRAAHEALLTVDSLADMRNLLQK